MALPLAVLLHAEAVEMVGMPEGFIPLAETTTYLALAPKSNASSYAAYLSAKREIMPPGEPCPCPCTCATRPPNSSASGDSAKGYKYPHSYPERLDRAAIPARRHWKACASSTQPKDQGQEPKLAARFKGRKKRLRLALRLRVKRHFIGRATRPSVPWELLFLRGAPGSNAPPFWTPCRFQKPPILFLRRI